MRRFPSTNGFRRRPRLPWSRRNASRGGGRDRRRARRRDQRVDGHPEGCGPDSRRRWRRRLTPRTPGSAFGADDHWLACLPLSHVGGLSVVTRSLRAGTRLTVQAGFDAERCDGQRCHPRVARDDGVGPHRPRRLPHDRSGRRPPSDRSPGQQRSSTYGMTETGSGVVYEGQTDRRRRRAADCRTGRSW